MDFLQIILQVLGVIMFLAKLVWEIIKIFIPLKYKMKEISGEIALVTGGAGGLGRSIAIELSKHGVIVVIWDINEKGIEETVKLIQDAGGICYGYVCNIINREEVYERARQLKKEIGKVTILINNAGVINVQKFQNIPDNKLMQTMQVNIISQFWTTKAFLPGMIECNKGHIVSIASIAGFRSFPYLVDYCTSKHGIIGFYDALDMELYSDGYEINTTVVCPTIIIGTGMKAESYIRSRSMIPFVSCEEVARQTIIAMRCNKKNITVPGYNSILRILNSIFPSIFFQVYYIFPKVYKITFCRK
ncbi:PREDICTED: 17-beta-hydroxysteroid dehydrogenase 13 [Polistes canadensis]|uniref:17-beta-hydroxysteroid dehydrogenase 13 n=1 Tax=Polistes canadensis TaxID=91411 RepID=UPI000718D68A|nr:PREDICTED: 17-beta-hydroxysteroid dehydrogenase 13 [Polistes canadensis]